MNAINKAFKQVFEPVLEWKVCEISGNWTASSDSKSFWIFDTKDGAQLYQMNLFSDEKLVGNFNNVDAAKLAAENLVHN